MRTRRWWVWLWKMQVTKQVGKRKAAVDTFTLKTTQGEEKVELSTNRNVLFETLRQGNQLDKSDYQRAGYGLKTLMYHPIMTLNRKTSRHLIISEIWIACLGKIAQTIRFL